MGWGSGVVAGRGWVLVVQCSNWIPFSASLRGCEGGGRKASIINTLMAFVFVGSGSFFMAGRRKIAPAAHVNGRSSDYNGLF